VIGRKVLVMPKGRPEKGYALTPQREKVLRILATAGGSLDDEAGLVVSKLREQTGHETTQALSMVIKQLEGSGLVKRDVTGRRTYHIELVPDALAPEDRARLGLNGTDHGTVSTPAPTVSFEEDEAPAPTDSDGTDYRRLADELLKAATTALAHKAGDPKLKARIADLEDRLELERARREHAEAQLIERGNELLAAKEALRIAEHNLATVQNQKAREKAERGSDTVAAKLTDRERRELADLKRIMEARPS
jgi:DNA-binding MarR family transcriptional regulator